MRRIIPSRVVFPFGYVVTVKRVTHTEITLANEDDPTADALWDDQARTILLDRNMPVRQQRYLLLHELEHAFADWKLWVAREGIAKDRKRDNHG